MRKWQDRAEPDDKGSWFDVGNMWPTGRGSYETADGSTGTTASSSLTFNGVGYAYFFDRNKEYVWLSNSGTGQVRYWNGSTFTDITPAAFSGAGWSVKRGLQCMASLGNVALACTSTVTAGSRIHADVSGSGSLTSVAASPQNQNILCIQSSSVFAASTAANTFSISREGDYTDWTNGNATSGTIYSSPGNVSAALAFGSDVYVFKPTAIHRFSITGGVDRWRNVIAWQGIGIPQDLTGTLLWNTNDWAVATRRGIAFYGGQGRIYMFDGASAPYCINPFTTIPVETILPVFSYDPLSDMLVIAPSHGSNASGQSVVDSSSSLIDCRYYYYHLQSDQWGTGYGSSAELEPGSTGAAGTSGPMRGLGIVQQTASPKPVYWYGVAGGSGYVKRCAPSSPGSSATCYVQTSMDGRADAKTKWDQVIPLMRRRTDLGTDSASLSVDLYRERHLSTATSTQTVSESTYRNRFDVDNVSEDNFARFKVTWSAIDAEVDDVLIKTFPGSED